MVALMTLIYLFLVILMFIFINTNLSIGPVLQLYISNVEVIKKFSSFLLTNLFGVPAVNLS